MPHPKLLDSLNSEDDLNKMCIKTRQDSFFSRGIGLQEELLIGKNLALSYVPLCKVRPYVSRGKPKNSL